MKDYNSAGTGFELPPKEELTEKDLERWATATYNTQFGFWEFEDDEEN
jgi:hypothetical protein